MGAFGGFIGTFSIVTILGIVLLATGIAVGALFRMGTLVVKTP